MSYFGGKVFCKIASTGDKKRLATQTLPQGADLVAEVAYGEHPLQRANIYRPTGSTGKLPVIIDIHGGGWYYGTHSLNFHFDRTICAKGYAVYSVGYRMAFEVDWTEQVRDCMRCLGKLTEIADDYELDLDRVFLVGDSAGGYLAMQVLRVLHDRPFAVALALPEYPITIHSACFTCGAFTLTKTARIPLARAFFGPILGKGYLKSPYVSLADATMPKGIHYPPVLFTSCYGDFMRKDVLATYQKTLDNGHDARLIFRDKCVTNKLSHVYNVLWPEWPESEETNNAMLAFFEGSLPQA